MLKSILNLENVQELNKNEQKMVNGGTGATCPTYSAQECKACGGYPLTNGCCLGTIATHACLSGIDIEE